MQKDFNAPPSCITFRLILLPAAAHLVIVISLTHQSFSLVYSPLTKHLFTSKTDASLYRQQSGRATMSHGNRDQTECKASSLSTRARISDTISLMLSNLYTIYLFTYSDQKTILFPETFFAVATSLSGPLQFHHPAPVASKILLHGPLALCWVYINLLPFDINNQRQPSGLVADNINKLWRPSPAGRISDEKAKTLMSFST